MTVVEKELCILPRTLPGDMESLRDDLTTKNLTQLWNMAFLLDDLTNLLDDFVNLLDELQ